MVEFIDKPFDEEERALMESVENSEDVRLPYDAESQLKDRLRTAARSVTIRMQHEDLAGIKKKAKEAGMPYQTLINSIIHRYLNGGLEFKTAV